MIGIIEQPLFYDRSVMDRSQQLVYVLTRGEYELELIKSTHRVFCFACHDIVEKNSNEKFHFFCGQVIQTVNDCIIELICTQFNV